MTSINTHTNELRESIHENLQGSVDFHLHSHVAQGYRWNLMEMAQKALSVGMSAMVIKNLFGTSQEACHIANRYLGKTFLYPSLTLCRTVGGLNPHAVDQFSIAHTANRIIEMPVFDSIYEIQLRHLTEDQGLPIFLDNVPAPGLPEILKLVAERDMVLKTGHSAPSESLRLIRLARDAGVKKIVVTHATGAPVMATLKEQKEMADMGALIEHCYIKFMPISKLLNMKRFPEWQGPEFADLNYLKASLETVGPDHCIAATDAGQVYNPSPHELFITLLYLLEELGCSKEEIRIMTGSNPRKLLGLSHSPPDK